MHAAARRSVRIILTRMRRRAAGLGFLFCIQFECVHIARALALGHFFDGLAASSDAEIVNEKGPFFLFLFTTRFIVSAGAGENVEDQVSYFHACALRPNCIRSELLFLMGLLLISGR